MDKCLRVLVEIYRPEGREGRWIVEWDGVELDLAYMRSCIKSIRNDSRYSGAKLQLLQDGNDFVIGVFCDGAKPAGPPKSGAELPLEKYEASD